MKILLLVLAAISMPYSLYATAGTLEHFIFDSGHGTSEFLATGRPGSFKIKGKGNGPSGELNIDGKHVVGVLNLDLNSFDTGMKLRNEHMKSKYLQTERFPAAKLAIDTTSFLTSPLTKETKIDHGILSGKLTLHGVTKDVHGTFDINFDGTKLSLLADLEVNISEFGIEKPSFSGVSVDDKVLVHLVSDANLKK